MQIVDSRLDRYSIDLIRLDKLKEKNDWFDQVKDKLLKVFVDGWKLVSIYQLHGDMTFEEAILQTLCNGNKHF